MKAADILAKLKAQGWQKLRQKGSHIQMGKGDKRTTVPDHGKKDLRPGTLSKIQRDTGIKF